VGSHGDLRFQYAYVHYTTNLTWLDIRTEQIRRQNENRDIELYQWLSPLNWSVESEIASLLDGKQEETFEWIARMPELQAWRSSKPQYYPTGKGSLIEGLRSASCGSVAAQRSGSQRLQPI
jgi:hypothetical protein